MNSGYTPGVLYVAHVAYSDAVAVLGNLGLPFESFLSRLGELLEKRIGVDATEQASCVYITSLRTRSLYLATACALGSEQAWLRLTNDYRGYLQRIAWIALKSRDQAEELVEHLFSDLCLLDRTGRIRIASYDGNTTLATWLRLIIMRRADDEKRRKWNRVERLDDLGDIPDWSWEEGCELRLRGQLYGGQIQEALCHAAESLDPSERELLLLHADDGVPGSVISIILAVNPSTVSRRLRQIYKKLRRVAEAALLSKHQLNPSAVQECLQEICENPRYSILAVLRAEDQKSSRPRTRVVCVL